MKCHVPGLNVKILGRTIHALARFGDELYLEALPDCLLLRTLNASESAYAMVKFNKSFFAHFNYNYYATENNAGLKCKISMKSALSAFKSPAHMDKQVETLEIKLDPESSKLIFQLRCKQGVVKTHFVSILDCKATEALYSKDMIPNRVMAHHKVLSEAMTNFQSSEDQITIEVSPQTFIVRNYIDNNVDFTKFIRTQLNINPAEFDMYTIGVDTLITFSVKEFRAILNFAEALNLQFVLSFETTGRPAVFIVHNSSTFEANFVLATVKPDTGTQANTTQATMEQENNNTSNKRNYEEVYDGSAAALKKPHLDIDTEVSKRLDEDSHLFNFIDLPDEHDKIRKTKTNSHLGHTNLSKYRLSNGTSKINPELKSNRMTAIPHVVDIEESVSIMDEDIPASPEHRIRTVFKRCFDKTLDPSKIHQPNILAENSDNE